MKAQTLLAIVVSAALCCPHVATLAQTPVKKVPMRPIASVSGKDVYRAYCENCHGDDLKGHGPDAAGLRVLPPDLTTIALRNGGEFSSGAVREAILGWNKMPRTVRDFADKRKTEETGEVTAAAPVMPAFGPIFGALYPQDRRERDIRIDNLVSYIKKMQGTSAP